MELAQIEMRTNLCYEIYVDLDKKSLKYILISVTINLNASLI